jgi:LysM repeat protein
MKRIFLTLLVVLLLSTGLGARAVSAESTCGDKYTVQRGDYLVKIANKCGTTVSAILNANPSIKKPSLIYPGQVLIMPKDGQNIPITGGSIYIVKPGDTMSAIASLFKVTLTDLLKANPSITNASKINAGQQIKLPEGAAQVLTAGITPVKAKPGDVVTLGATGFDASVYVELRFGTSKDQTEVIGNTQTDANGAVLQKVNVPTNAESGKEYVFVVRTKDAGKQAVSNTLTISGTSTGIKEYTVLRGDTLRKIANKFNSTVAAIVAANPSIKDPNLIYPGQVLKIPSGQSGPAVSITPTSGAVGTKITIVADGFPSSQNVDIDLGIQGKDPSVVKDGKTDSAGYLRVEITLPSSAKAGEKWVVTVHTTDLVKVVSATSAVFTVK